MFCTVSLNNAEYLRFLCMLQFLNSTVKDYKYIHGKDCILFILVNLVLRIMHSALLYNKCSKRKKLISFAE